ncbi:GIY-YIG nuclease family protein [Clostridium sp. 'White wine YQ']|uniref:GIY-YIG nuclease family protein n=1 Tax=Clostridium sp. 'White wine YQ' TaxID=3027474 RepID=UPI00236548A4|nr:GIY-YIG nuclease family protein [Clostridium sp. 'White wine YQ']MDD7794098.1 GIY-YIG nuclease family protein [Clostridium sp. 'White wine YQ']
MNLKEKIKELPSTPGVYLMKDSLNNIIYVGKSKNLKSRVGSYFQNSKSHSPKVIKLVQNLKDFDYILTDTEFEAFMLECKLIKEIKPRYNRLMKSPNSYSYIKININDKYPNLELSQSVTTDDGNIYLGPYKNKNTLEKCINNLKDFYKIQCSYNSRKGSACLNYSLGLCMGMCIDKLSREEYMITINKIINLLNNEDKSIIYELESSMNTASENFDFENAAKYRDYLTSVNYLINKVKVIEYTKENKNIVLLEPLNSEKVKIFLISGTEILYSYIGKLDNFDELKENMKNYIHSYFNSEILSSSIQIGRDEIDQTEIIYSYVKNKSNNCRYIVISEKWLASKNITLINEAINMLIKGEC